jgi:predicted outer membrane repeat protein
MRKILMVGVLVLGVVGQSVWGIGWNGFVEAYKTAGFGATVTLDNDIVASEAEHDGFEDPESTKLLIDGNYKKIDSQNYMGRTFMFVLLSKDIIFQNITFENFAAMGAMLLDNNNKVTFNGEITFQNNNSFYEGLDIGWGGGIGAIESEINFNNSDVLFDGNSGRYAGGIYGENAQLSFTVGQSNNVLFENNTKATGVLNDIYVTNSKLSFDIAEGAKAQFLSGIEVAAQATITKAGAGTLLLSGINKFANLGGDFSVEGIMIIDGANFIWDIGSVADTRMEMQNLSSVTFIRSDVEFKNSQNSQIGGAIETNGSNLYFLTSSVTFINNSAVKNGGALAINNDSSAYFFNSKLYFLSNNTLIDGALFGDDNSVATFERSKVLFEKNAGGAIYLIDYSSVVFNNSQVNFLDNDVVDSGGGAIYSRQYSHVYFKNSTATFIDNSAQTGGGAIYVADGLFSFENSSATFINNLAPTDGAGALFFDVANVEIKSAKIDFINNSAADGGAIVGEQSDILFKDSKIKFIGNNAADLGGAILLIESIFTFEDSTIWFENNLVQGEKNDVHLYDADSILQFSGNVNFTNGIRTNGLGKIEKIGEGNVVFDGEDSFIDNNFHISKGAAVFLSQQSTVSVLGMESEHGAVLSLAEIVGYDSNGSPLPLGAAGKTPQSLYVLSDFNLSGYLVLDFDFQKSVADFILVGGQIAIETSTLTVSLISKATVHGSSIIFMSALSVDGADNLFINFPDYQIDFNDADNSFWLSYVGESVVRQIPKVALTGNQYQVQKTLTRMENWGDSKLQDQVFNIADNRGKPKARKALDMLSGSFIAEALAQTVLVQNGDLLFEKTKMIDVEIAGRGRDESGGVPLVSSLREIAGQARNDDGRGALTKLIQNSAWGQGAVSQLNIDHRDSSSLGLTKNTGLNLSAGAMIAAGKGKSVGVFVSGGQNSIEQETNSANVQNFEGGFYGGIFQKDKEYKFYLSIAQHDFTTRREINLEKNYVSQAKFNAYSFKVGSEFDYTLIEQKVFNIVPFAQVNAALLHNQQIKETHGQDVALIVEANDYKTLTGLAGLKIENLKQDFSWYVKMQAGYLFYGNDGESQYDISFRYANDPAAMHIRALEIKSLTYGISAGADFAITEVVNVYAGLQYSGNRSLTFITANAGVKFMFDVSEPVKNYQARNKELKILRAAQRQKQKEKRLLEKQKQAQIKAQEKQAKLDAQNLEIQQEQAILEQERQRQKLIKEIALKKKEEIARQKREAKLQRQKEAKELEEKIKELKRINELENKEIKEQEQRQKYEAQQRQESFDRQANAKKTFRLLSESFEGNSAKLTKKAKAAIKEIATDISKTEYDYLTIEGHSDDRNLINPQSRAQAVADELEKNSIPKEKILAIGLGAIMPIAENVTKAGRIKNQRVEILVE